MSVGAPERTMGGRVLVGVLVASVAALVGLASCSQAAPPQATPGGAGSAASTTPKTPPPPTTPPPPAT
jgi:hypothetical protein